MQISLKWVNELVTLENLRLEDLIHKLTLGGFEVEEILEIEIDHQKTLSLDISATANRSDSLSIQGLSLEMAALFHQPPNVSPYSTKEFSWRKETESFFKNSFQTNDCSGLMAITVEEFQSFVAPKWLQQKLLASGITPQNNLTDFQTYIRLETGYPFEFYDLDKIYKEAKGSKFSLKLTNGKREKNFYAENGITYPVDESILILKANDIPISIAGIIPHQSVAYSNKTRSLLIEGSIFKAAKIRQQSRLLGVRTDRSSRYEKSLKPTYLLEAVYRLVSLFRIQNPNLVVQFHTIVPPVKEINPTIRLDYQTVKEVLGPIGQNSDNTYQYISPQTITDSLIRLNFKVNYDDQKACWDVTIPSVRNEDILLEIDVIEEIGRIYGFHKFLTRVPKIGKIGTEDFHYQTRKKLTTCLLNLGFNELVQYSLVNEKTFIRNEIELVNPLVNDYSHLRASLLPNLVKAVEENLNNHKSILEGFEYGHIFSGNRFQTLKEKEYVAGIFGGRSIKSNWSDTSHSLNWFEAKGQIEQLFQKLNLKTVWKSYTPIQEKEILHPYRTSEISFNQETRLGVFGQIHPFLVKQLGIPSDLYLFEFDVALIQQQMQQNQLTIYQDYSVYPKIVKDLSFLISSKIPFQKIQEILYLNGSQFLKTIDLLDEYKGSEVPKGQTSLCLQFTFQSDQETLQTKTVEQILENLKVVLIHEFDVTIRD